VCVCEFVCLASARVHKALRALDPEGIAIRSRYIIKRRTYQSKGPWFAFHVDCYAKLAFAGFPITAFTDGYSSRIMILQILPAAIVPPLPPPPPPTTPPPPPSPPHTHTHTHTQLHTHTRARAPLHVRFLFMITFIYYY